MKKNANKKTIIITTLLIIGTLLIITGVAGFRKKVVNFVRNYNTKKFRNTRLLYRNN